MACNCCGAESGKFFLCFKCKTLKDEGKIEKCAECGKWHKVGEPCACKKETTPAPTKPATVVKTVPAEKAAKHVLGNGTCIVCGEAAPNGYLCRDCYYEMRDYKEAFDKNSKSFDMKDYYYNLRSNIYRMKTFDFVKSNCNKLMAIANFVSEMFRDSSLTDRVANDINDLIASKKPKEEEKEKVSEETISKDSHKEELRRTCDGHYVKSDPEVIIDDILYNSRIVHCYEKKVPIDSDEPAVTCDWFIPVTDGRHGIYIEYWGMNTKDYLANKERKKASYKKHDIPLIEIEKDDYRDRQNLEYRIIDELNHLAEKYYGVRNFQK